MASCVFIIVCLLRVQEIDSLLAGGLTDEDEDDVLKELEQIVKVYFICFQLLTCDIMLAH